MGWVLTQLCQGDPTVQWALTQPCQEDPPWGGCSPSHAAAAYRSPAPGLHPNSCGPHLPAGSMGRSIGIECATTCPGTEPRSLASREPAMGRAQAGAGGSASRLTDPGDSL